MKKELIKTDNYLLVVDGSEIKVGNWVYNQVSKEMYRFNENLVNYEKKVIAHLPINDSADLKGVPLLPPFEVEDDEKILFANEIENMLEYDRGRWYGRIEGYNKAREKYKFTEEGAKYLFECGRNFQINADITFTVVREHLSQPKMPTYFEFEMEDNFSKNDGEYIDESGAKGNYYTHSKIIKTTTNSQGQQVACGKYIY